MAHVIDTQLLYTLVEEHDETVASHNFDTLEYSIVDFAKLNDLGFLVETIKYKPSE